MMMMMMRMVMPTIKAGNNDNTESNDDDDGLGYIGRAILWTNRATTVAACVLFNLQCVMMS